MVFSMLPPIADHGESRGLSSHQSPPTRHKRKKKRTLMLTSVDRFDLGHLSHTGKVKLLEETVRRRLDLVSASGKLVPDSTREVHLETESAQQYT